MEFQSILLAEWLYVFNDWTSLLSVSPTVQIIKIYVPILWLVRQLVALSLILELLLFQCYIY